MTQSKTLNITLETNKKNFFFFKFVKDLYSETSEGEVFGRRGKMGQRTHTHTREDGCVEESAS